MTPINLYHRDHPFRLILFLRPGPLFPLPTASGKGIAWPVAKIWQMKDSSTIRIGTDSPEATQAVAGHLAAALERGDVLALVGPLGAGKTCFVQGMAAAMGVTGRVASPTFILMRAHPGPLPLYHADAYRLSSADDLLDIGLDDWLAAGVVALEWADQVPEALPQDHLQVAFEGDDGHRELTFTARGPRGRALLEHMRRWQS